MEDGHTVYRLMSSDFQDFHHVLARKPHRCDHCQTMIEAGKVYQYGAGIWEGDWFTQHCHLDCVDAARTVHDYQGLTWGDSYPWLYELEQEDLDYLINHFPIVHSRILAGRGISDSL